MVTEDFKVFRGDILEVVLKYKATSWSPIGKNYFLVTSAGGVKINGMPLISSMQYENIYELKVVVPELPNANYYASITDICTIDKFDVVRRVSYMSNPRYQILVNAVHNYMIGNIVFYERKFIYATRFNGVRSSEEECAKLDRILPPLENYIPVEDGTDLPFSVNEDTRSDSLEQATAEPVVIEEDDDTKCSHRFENGKSALELQSDGRAICTICNRYPTKTNTLGNIPELDQKASITLRETFCRDDEFDSLEDCEYYAYHTIAEIVLKYGCPPRTANSRKSNARKKLGIRTSYSKTRFYTKGAENEDLENLISMTAKEVMEIYSVSISKARSILKRASDELELRLDNLVDEDNGISSSDFNVEDMSIDELKEFIDIDARDLIKQYNFKSIEHARKTRYSAFIRLKMTACPYVFTISKDMMFGRDPVPENRKQSFLPLKDVVTFEKSIYDRWEKIKDLWSSISKEDILFIKTADDMNDIRKKFDLDEECSNFLKLVALKATSSSRRAYDTYMGEELNLILNGDPFKVMERYLINAIQYRALKIRLTNFYAK